MFVHLICPYPHSSSLVMSWALDCSSRHRTPINSPHENTSWAWMTCTSRHEAPAPPVSPPGGAGTSRRSPPRRYCRHRHRHRHRHRCRYRHRHRCRRRRHRARPGPPAARPPRRAGPHPHPPGPWAAHVFPSGWTSLFTHFVPIRTHTHSPDPHAWPGQMQHTSAWSVS